MFVYFITNPLVANIVVSCLVSYVVVIAMSHLIWLLRLKNISLVTRQLFIIDDAYRPAGKNVTERAYWIEDPWRSNHLDIAV